MLAKTRLSLFAGMNSQAIRYFTNSVWYKKGEYELAKIQQGIIYFLSYLLKLKKSRISGGIRYIHSTTNQFHEEVE